MTTETGTGPGTITSLLERIRDGDRAAQDHLLELVYDELRRRAQARLRGVFGVDLGGTGLAHAAVIRLLGGRGVVASNREHLWALFGKVMNGVVSNAIDAATAAKRNNGRSPAPLGDPPADELSRAVDVEALDQALTALWRHSPSVADVVTLRTFGDRTNDEVAMLLDITPQAATRKWQYGCAWIRLWLAQRRLGPPGA